MDFKFGGKTDQPHVTIPALFNVSDSQFSEGLANSYWATSFVTASNNHQYMVVCQVLYYAELPYSIARGSVVDVTDPSFYDMFVYPEAKPISLVSNDSRLHAPSGKILIEGISEDSVAVMRASNAHPQFPYNLTFEGSTQILFNGGLGKFTLGDGDCGEWAIPSGRTWGTLRVKGEDLQIDPDNSFTWFDRQWTEGVITEGNYTWFSLVLPGTDLRASMWAIDDVGRGKFDRFATFRLGNGSHAVVPFEFESSWDDLFISNSTGSVYPKKWTLKFPDGGTLEVKTVRADQEMASANSSVQPLFDGFSEYKVTNVLGYNGWGYGVTEIIYL